MTVNNCHPLKSVCILLNAVGNHLSRREFMSPSLTEELLPKSTRIIYKSAAADETREDALPIVAYAVNGISLKPYHPQHHMGGYGSTTAEMSGAITFTVSTTNEALTSELAFELASYCMSIHKAMQEYEMYVGEVGTGAVQRGKAGYFEAQVQLQAYLGKPTWKLTNESDILREIGISLHIH